MVAAKTKIVDIIAIVNLTFVLFLTVSASLFSKETLSVSLILSVFLDSFYLK